MCSSVISHAPWRNFSRTSSWMRHAHRRADETPLCEDELAVAVKWQSDSEPRPADFSAVVADRDSGCHSCECAASVSHRLPRGLRGSHLRQGVYAHNRRAAAVSRFTRGAGARNRGSGRCQAHSRHEPDLAPHAIRRSPRSQVHGATRRSIRSMKVPANRFLRHLPDRLLHARRRAAATALLRRSDVTSILFVCHGNVCRSPYAEAAFARALDRRAGVSVQVASAGFIGPGRIPPETALAAAERRGLDLSDHRSRLVTPEIIRAASVVVVMAADQAAGIRFRYGRDVHVLMLGDLDPLPIATRTVTDPWGRSANEFDLVFDRIDRCIGELVRFVFADETSAVR